MKYADMKKATIFIGAALAGVVLFSAAAAAQGVPQTVDIAKVDVQQLSAGYRASKVIGSSVLNNANETIGKIDDLLISPDGKTPFVVLSIGGFLGMDGRYVVVPYDSLKLVDNKVVLPSGTKDMLRMLPEFKYAAR
jgi:sporulation protein YlmC with PRC-barrel domain